MFGLRKSERSAYEAHIASLTEQVHWLRSCLPWVVPMGGAAGVGTRLGADTPPPLVALDSDDSLPFHMSDEEEDVRDALAKGDIDLEEAKAILKTLGLNDEIDFA